MRSTSVRQMAGRVSALLEERLGIPGADLDEKLSHGGRRLPRRIRAEAARLAEAERIARDPATHAEFDPGRVAQAYDASMAYLQSVGAWRRRLAAVLQRVGGLALGLLALGVAVLAVLAWRGHL